MTVHTDRITGVVKERLSQNSSTRHTKGMMSNLAICNGHGMWLLSKAAGLYNIWLAVKCVLCHGTGCCHQLLMA